MATPRTRAPSMLKSHGEPVRPLAWALWLEVALFRSNTTIGGRPRRRFASTQARRRGQLRAVCGGLLQGPAHQRGPARPLSLKRRRLARGSPQSPPRLWFPPPAATPARVRVSPDRCTVCGNCGDGERRTACGGINGDVISDPVLADTVTATLNPHVALPRPLRGAGLAAEDVPL